MRFENDKIVLRDMEEQDIKDIVNWNTIETEWMKWDAPWEHEEEDNFDWVNYRKNKLPMIKALKESKELRKRLEVCILNEEETHIGSVSSYTIDDHFKIDEHGTKVAIGMDICLPRYRRNGYGMNAFKMYIEYLNSMGIHEIYTQTWSGNISLIKMAEKLGFQECNRYVNIRYVRGEVYDGLTFVLK